MQFAKFENSEDLKKILNKVNLKEDNILKSGIPIINEGEDTYITNDSYHNLVIGFNKSYKKLSIPIINTIIKSDESFLICDNDNNYDDIFKELLKNKGYKTYTFDFSNKTISSKWNPLTEIQKVYKEGKIDEAISLLDNLAEYLFVLEPTSDPFWIEKSSSLFIGVCLYLFDNKDKNIELFDVSKFLKDNVKDKESLQQVINMISKYDELNIIYSSLYEISTMPIETCKGILSVFEMGINRIIYKPTLHNLLSLNDYEIKELFNEKTAIFIKNDISNSSKLLISMFLSLFVQLQSIYKNKVKYNILIDDFDKITPIKNIIGVLSECRNKKIKLYFFIDSLSLIKNNYSEDEETSIVSSCGNIIYLYSRDLYTQEKISKLCGRKSENEELISIEELQTIKEDKYLFLTSRHNPYLARIIDAKTK